ncbi:MAG: DMT family transporter [Thaumarchaeota archaeon]|nr:DMT family transporter [Nitrososphaerota archaeon]
MFTPIILLPLLLVKKEYRRGLSNIRFLAIFGFIEFLLGVGQWAGLIFGVPVAVVAFLLYIQPVWTMLIARLWLSEEINRRKILALITAIIGVLVLVDVVAVSSMTDFTGLIFPLFAGVLLSLVYVLGRVGAVKGLHPVTLTFGLRGFQAVWALALYPVVAIVVKDASFSRLSFDLSLDVWLQLFAFSLFIGAGSGLLIFRGLKTVSASRAGIILLLEPIIGTILAAVFFMQAITLNIIVGGLLILLANYLVITERNSRG